MPEVAPSFLAGFSEQERIHFLNLSLIRPQLPSESQLQVLEGMARSLANPRLLTLMARTPHWLVHGPILQALAENESTPEPIRRDLEMVVSLFDLMREMDRAPAAEKQERAETVKAVYQQLPAGLKPIAKQQAKQLARPVSATGTTAELPPLPAADQDWETLTAPPEPSAVPTPRLAVPKEERLRRASGTHLLEELQAFLLDGDAEIRQAALCNPMVSEELLIGVLQQCLVPELFEDVYAEARWYFRDPIRAALYGAPGTPSSLARKIRVSQELIILLERGGRNAGSLRRTASLFTQLDEAEYQFVTYWAKKHAPNLLRVIKIFYDRLQRRRASQASGLAAQPPEGRWASLEERVFVANQATQPDQIIASLRDPNPRVFAVVLENPGLSPRELLAAIPAMDTPRVEKLAAHPTWGEHPSVREALLHNIHLTKPTALALLHSLDSPRALLDVLRDPRIPHLEVKEEALEALRLLYLAMDAQQRILALRSNGGELLRHLPQEILKDETTLQQLISDRQLDPSILLRLARNKLTPRSILARIAVHPILMAHPAIMSELLLNPKTPRESSTRIWGLLSESEQQQLLRSPHLPTTLRHLA